MTENASRLRTVQVVHTAACAFFAACVISIPFAAWSHRVALAALLIGFVALESLVLLINGWRCPLAGVAARSTDDRRDNFDIHLSEWLARYNKAIFGSL